jgi:hypothetical protein
VAPALKVIQNPGSADADTQRLDTDIPRLAVYSLPSRHQNAFSARNDDARDKEKEWPDMGLFGLCSEDELVRTLRESLGANPVRVPELRIQPLCVVATRKDKVAFRGELGPMLEGSPDVDLPPWAIAESPMVDLSQRRTRSVDANVGLSILENFLSGFGIPAPGIAAQFSGAKSVDFAFRNVSRKWVDNNWLGRALSGRAIDLQNKSARIHLKKWRLLVIDSIIRSKGITITVTEKREQSFGIDIGVIEELIGELNTDVTVSSETSTNLTISGPTPLTFAFTAVEFHLDEHGNLLSAPPAGDSVALSARSAGHVPTYGLDHIELSERPALIEWDEVNET